MVYKVSRNWGGSRNSACRKSNSLSYAQCLMIDAAVVNAFDCGFYLNRFTTINWSLVGIAPKQASNATARFFKLARDWANKKGENVHWVYIREANDNGLNHHLHILIHIPETIAKLFFVKARKWIAKISGQKYKAKAIYTRSIGSRVDTYKINPEVYELNLITLVRRYLFKGASRQTVKPFNLPIWERGGLIYGKRCGCSKSLSMNNFQRV